MGQRAFLKCGGFLLDNYGGFFVFLNFKRISYVKDAALLFSPCFSHFQQCNLLSTNQFSIKNQKSNRALQVYVL